MKKLVVVVGGAGGIEIAQGDGSNRVNTMVPGQDRLEDQLALAIRIDGFGFGLFADGDIAVSTIGRATG